MSSTLISCFQCLQLPNQPRALFIFSSYSVFVAHSKQEMEHSFLFRTICSGFFLLYFLFHYRRCSHWCRSYCHIFCYCDRDGSSCSINIRIERTLSDGKGAPKTKWKIWKIIISIKHTHTYTSEQKSLQKRHPLQHKSWFTFIQHRLTFIQYSTYPFDERFWIDSYSLNSINV